MAAQGNWSGGQGPSGLVVDAVADVVTEVDGDAAYSADQELRQTLQAILEEVKLIRIMLAAAFDAHVD
jgi:hypothetical protein